MSMEKSGGKLSSGEMSEGIYSWETSDAVLAALVLCLAGASGLYNKWFLLTTVSLDLGFVSFCVFYAIPLCIAHLPIDTDAAWSVCLCVSVVHIISKMCKNG